MHRVAFLPKVSLECGILILLLIGPISLHADLVAHYELDGNGLDSSINANHGTVNGAVATSDRNGVAGGALLFDGVNDFVNVSQLLFDGDDATVAYWAQSAGPQSGITVMVSQGHWGADAPFDSGFAFQYSWPTSTETNLVYGDNAGGAHSWLRLDFGIDIEQTSQWHHFAFTKSGNNITIFLDGTPVTSSTSGMVFSNYGFTIGADTFNGGRNFNGAIDDVFVFDHALTAAQVNQLAATIPEPSTLIPLVALVAIWSNRRR